MGAFNFGNLTSNQIVELAALSNASYPGQSPPAGWAALTGTQLGFQGDLLTGIYISDTFIGGINFFGAPAAQVYRKGDELAISFRGTDTRNPLEQALDYATYLDIIGNNNYINAFNTFLDAVQSYAIANNITDIKVTGHSLGGAAVNILRNVSDTKNNGFFDDATYFSIATPKVSGNSDILNVGFENDWVFKAIARNTPFVDSDFFSTTDNLVLYDDAYAEADFPGFFFDPTDVTAHSSTGHIEAIDRITKSYFYDKMSRDSVVIVVATDEQVTDKDTSTSDHFGKNAFYVGRAVADDILGGTAKDYIDGGGGDDKLQGGLGDDEIFGGTGQDVVKFLGDCLEYNISKSADGTITVTHARGSMLDGIDVLKDVEVAQFANGKKLDLTPDQVFGCTEIGFASDFVVGSTQDTRVEFILSRVGDTTYPITFFLDGEVDNRADVFFNDGFQQVEEGDSPQIIITASVSEVFGDVRFSFTISIDESDPVFPFVTITDDTATGLLIGDQVDNRGGNAWGDPHLITFDNVAYDFQAAGDFVLARATEGDPYEVQARFVALNSVVSVTNAIATTVGASTVSVEVGNAIGIVRIDDVIVDLANGETIAVDGGSVTRNGRTIDIDHGNGDVTRADVFGSFMNVTPSPSLARPLGGLEGLLGDGDGNPGNEFQLDDGTVLMTPVPIATLYGAYAESWLVDPADSLLPGDPEPFVPPGRIITIDSLPTSLRDAAEAAVDALGITNPLLREAAILDFALTGDPEFIEAANLVDDAFDPIVGTVPIDPIVNPVVILTSDRSVLDEDDPAERTATLTVARGSTEGTLEISYNVIGAGSSPADADDFGGAFPSDVLFFEDGEETLTFEIDVSDDALDEGEESFDVLITLSGEDADDYELLISSVRLAIEDDDEVAVNLVLGTGETDYLTGTDGDDDIRSFAGSYDRMSGGQGADRFIFGAEMNNGVRERNVIDDYEVGQDIILLEDGAAVGSVRQMSSGVALFFQGDNDAVYVRGDGVSPDTLTIVESDLLLI